MLSGLKHGLIVTDGYSTQPGESALVTGAAGFIGIHLTKDLASRGGSVTAVDLRPLPESGEGRVRGRRVDLRDVDAVRPLLDGIDVVYHLASAHLQASAPESLFREINVDAAAALVRAAADAGVRRLVHASTVGVYGHIASPPAREDSPTAPGNRYERTKLLGEYAMRDAAARCGLDLVVLRPAWVYGPGCPRTAKLLRSVRTGRFFYVGSGRNLRHPIFVDDAVRAFIAAGAAPAGATTDPLIIAGPRYVELREIVDTAARVLGVRAPSRSVPRSLMLAAGAGAEFAWGAVRREPPFSRRSIAFFENDNAFDTGAARQQLGFSATIDLEEGLRRTVAASPDDTAPSHVSAPHPQTIG